MFSGYENLDYAELIMLISQFPYKNESDKNLLDKTFESLGILIENQLTPVVIQKPDWHITENVVKDAFEDENYTTKFIYRTWYNRKEKRIADDFEVLEYVKKNKLPYFEHHHHVSDGSKNFNKYLNLNETFYKMHLKFLIENAQEASAEKDAYGTKRRKTIMKTARKLKADWKKQCLQKKN